MTVVNQPLTLQFNGSGPQTLSNSDGSAVTSTTNANLIVITTPQAGPPVPIDRAGAPLDLSANVTDASAGPFPQVPTIVPSDAQNEGTILSPYSVSQPPGAIVVASGPLPPPPAPAFDPTQVPGVTAMLLNTLTSGNVTQWVDQLYTTNPATPRSAPNPPTANSDASISFNGINQVFIWPPAGNNFNPVHWGFGVWIKPTSLAVSPVVFSNRNGGTNVYKIFVGNDGSLNAIVWSNAAVSRNAASAAGVITINNSFFLTVEYDGNQALESDRFIFTVNNVKIALTFSTDTSMPAICATPTGNHDIGDQAGGQFFTGRMSSYLVAMQGAGGLSGGGCITSAQRQQIMNYAPLT